MNIRTFAAVLTAGACLSLTAACSGSAENVANAEAGGAKPSSKERRTEDPGCAEAARESRDEWIPECAPDPDEAVQGASASPSATAGTRQLRLGRTVTTVGTSGRGALALSPSTVLDTSMATGEAPDKDLFTIVAVRAEAVGAASADEATPQEHGGWRWITRSGRTIDAGDGNSAFNVVPRGFENAGRVRPGAHDWRVAVFDLTGEEREGGTLAYVDGAGATFRWRVPGEDAGPYVGALSHALTR
ncbi:hypothetical protein [Streptomyces sp. ODS28]|uniref:hypothetical protein n=1 Tax=Streptomyces sp. ODS28 TaxID=3136688 RepID=UPI0031E8EE8F